MHNQRTSILPLASALFCLTLSGCGGSSSNDSKPENTYQPGTSGGTLLSESQFENALLQFGKGVWLVDVSTDFTTDMSSHANANRSYSVQQRYTMTRAISIQTINGELYSDGCDIYGLGHFTEEDEWEDDDEYGYCENEQDYTYQIDSNTFMAETVCNGTVVQKATLSRISTDPTFNLGHLNFSASKSANLNATQGVCGSISKSEATLPQALAVEMSRPEHLEGWQFTVAAPYNGHRLVIEMDFFNSPFTPGTYTVTDWNDFTDFTVSVSLESKAFNPQQTFEYELDATSGSVTINTVNSHSVNGTFNLTLDDGNVLQGSFGVDLL